MTSISERESREIEAANAPGTTPVVFIHGLWLLPSSWANWADFFKQAGYAPLTPDWPDDPETVEEARANPDVLAKKTLKQVVDHTADVIGKLEKKPAVMGHSTGGLFAQLLAGRGLSAATVAIDPGVFRGVLPLPLSTLRASGPFLLNPRYRGRAITLTFDQFKYGWTLKAVLGFARRGDVVVVHTLDRLGRTVRDTLNLMHDLSERGVGVRNLADPIRVDTASPDDPMAQLAVVMLALFGQMERTYARERAAHARAVAVAHGRRVGRPRLVGDDQLDYARRLRDDGYSISDIVARTGIARTSLYRYLPPRPAAAPTAEGSAPSVR